MALRPARSASRTVGTSLPMLDAMPIPVMTARLMSRFPENEPCRRRPHVERRTADVRSTGQRRAPFASGRKPFKPAGSLQRN
ncbi:hypothetical protein OWS73_20260 [Burkholderia sp. 1B3(2022)]|uniref:hypothetical protein n=1 Tax=Burkholderia sp. 1B3(2022) TaxID=2997425 RepID=UPI002FC5F2B3